MWPGACPLGKRCSNLDLTQDSSASHPLKCLKTYFGVALQRTQIILFLNFCPEFLTVISEMFSQWSISPLPQTLPFKDDWPGVLIMIQNGLSDSAWEAGLQPLYQQKLSVELPGNPSCQEMQNIEQNAR